MFKPLLQSRENHPHVDVEPPTAADARETMCETEADAEGHMGAAVDEAASCVVSLPISHGGVDAGDVLHVVHPVEVHACVEAELCADDGNAAQAHPDAATKPRRC